MRLTYQFSIMLLALPGIAHAGQQFVSITAQTGAEWVEQCERPATKSQPDVRRAACFSYLKAAMTFADKDDAGVPLCEPAIRNAMPAAIFDVTLQAAQDMPQAPIGQLFRMVFGAVAGMPCPTTPPRS